MTPGPLGVLFQASPASISFCFFFASILQGRKKYCIYLGFPDGGKPARHCCHWTSVISHHPRLFTRSPFENSTWQLNILSKMGVGKINTHRDDIYIYNCIYALFVVLCIYLFIFIYRYKDSTLYIAEFPSVFDATWHPMKFSLGDEPAGPSNCFRALCDLEM